MFSRNKIAMVVAELFGTMVLTSVFLSVSRSPIGLPYFVALAVGLTIAILTLVVGPTSGAHFNPAVTLGMWTIRKINTLETVAYLVAQFAGAALAWKLFTYLTNGPVKSIAGANFDWNVVVAELVGAAIFTFGFAAAVYQKYEGGRLAAAVGGSFVLAVLVASVASNGILNPAVALGAQSWSKAYVFSPLVGAVVGMNVYGLLFAPADAFLGVPARATRAKAPVRKTATKKPASRKRR